MDKQTAARAVNTRVTLAQLIDPTWTLENAFESLMIDARQFRDEARLCRAGKNYMFATMYYHWARLKVTQAKEIKRRISTRAG